MPPRLSAGDDRREIFPDVISSQRARLLEQANNAFAASAQPVVAQTGTLTQLIDYIIDKHHVFTREEMERIGALLEKVCAKHGGNHPEVLSVRTLFLRLCADLRPHMYKEEAVLRFGGLLVGRAFDSLLVASRLAPPREHGLYSRAEEGVIYETKDRRL